MPSNHLRDELWWWHRTLVQYATFRLEEWHEFNIADRWPRCIQDILKDTPPGPQSSTAGFDTWQRKREASWPSYDYEMGTSLDEFETLGILNTVPDLFKKKKKRS